MSLRPAGGMHLPGRDHGGDAAVEAALDPADLVLPRRPVAQHRMDVAVDQPGRDRAAMRVDGGIDRAAGGQFGAAADGQDAAILDQDGIGLQASVRPGRPRAAGRCCAPGCGPPRGRKSVPPPSPGPLCPTAESSPRPVVSLETKTRRRRRRMDRAGGLRAGGAGRPPAAPRLPAAPGAVPGHHGRRTGRPPCNSPRCTCCWRRGPLSQNLLGRALAMDPPTVQGRGDAADGARAGGAGPGRGGCPAAAGGARPRRRWRRCRPGSGEARAVTRGDARAAVARGCRRGCGSDPRRSSGDLRL